MNPKGYFRKEAAASRNVHCFVVSVLKISNRWFQNLANLASDYSRTSKHFRNNFDLQIHVCFNYSGPRNRMVFRYYALLRAKRFSLMNSIYILLLGKHSLPVYFLTRNLCMAELKQAQPSKNPRANKVLCSHVS